MNSEVGQIVAIFLDCLEVPTQDKGDFRLEHVDVVVVVFDVEHFGHDAGSVPLLTAVRVWASRRMRSTRSAG